MNQRKAKARKTRPVPQQAEQVVDKPLKLRIKVRPRNGSQNEYLDLIAMNDMTFGLGPAGTGKTWLAVGAAVEALVEKRVQKIILVRPAVEAGEKLGYLPGTLQEKVDPYMVPLYDALEDFIGGEKVKNLIANKTIEIAPLAFMRGRTLKNAFILCDEAQNTTPEQMKMLLTRFGENSKAVITGDLSQIDLPRGASSGLVRVTKLLKDVRGIGFHTFDAADIVRHPLVNRIVEAFEREEN